MAGYRRDYSYNRQIIVMDGSRTKAIEGIARIIGFLSAGQVKHIFAKPIDRDHPTMIVLRFRATTKTFKDIEWNVDDHYPGLCVFDPLLKLY